MKFRSYLFFAVAVLGLLSMNSCVKQYNCRCSTYYSGTPGLPDSTWQDYQIYDSKSNAKSMCEKQSATYDNGGIHTTISCVLF